jgi:hypothetical protein
MPVVREPGPAMVSTGHPSASLESPETATAVDPGGFDTTRCFEDTLDIPPPIQQNPVLRI